MTEGTLQVVAADGGGNRLFWNVSGGVKQPGLTFDEICNLVPVTLPN